MIVCPVCEHQQSQGSACEVCGKVLVAPQPVSVVTQPLAELESTALPGGGQGVAVQRMAELDDHRAGAVPALQETMPEIERTRHADAGPVGPREAMPEVEPTRFADDGQRTAVSATLRCRYCGHVQQAGVLCDRCGLRMPGVELRQAAKAKSLEPEPIACPACSVKGAAGTRCLACGAFIRIPEL